MCSFIDSQGQSHLEKGRCPMHVKVWRFKNHKINRVKSGILWINIKFEVLFVIEQQVLLRCYWTRNFSSVLRYYSVFPFYLLVLSIKCHEVICKVLVGVVISPSREEPGTWNLEPALRQSVNSSITVNENSGNCCLSIEQALVKCTRVLFCPFLWSMVLINAICRKFYIRSV